VTITLIENFRALFYVPFYAPFALGAFAAEGLDVQLQASADASHTAQKLLAGHGDVSWGGPLRLMMALERNPGAGGFAFCEAVGRDPFFLLARDPNPGFRFEDLTRLTLAVVSEVPTPSMCLRQDLRLAGVAPERLRLAPPRTMAENAAALRTGAVDVIQVFHPYAGELVREGAAHVWYAAAGRGLVSYTTLNTTRAYAERHPGVLAGMCRALQRSLAWIAAHEGGEIAALVGSYFPGMPAALLAACCDDYKARGLWNRTPLLDPAGFDWLRDAALADGLLNTRFAFDECVDLRHARDAVRA